MAAVKTKDDGLKKLKEKLTAADVCGIYLFTGEETFNKDFYISKFKNKFSDNPMAEFNLLTFDGKEVSTEIILSAIESYPVMADNKLIIIKNSGIFKSVNDNDKQLWTDIFENPPEYAAIIFDEQEIDGRSALLKNFNSSGLQVRFDYLDSRTMASWIKSFLDKKGYLIEDDAISELMNRAGSAMSNVHNEMNKLIDFCGDTKKITVEHICQTVARSLQDKIFDMLDSVTSGKRDTAFSLLADLRTLREEPAKIITLLGNNISSLIKVKILLASGNSNIAAELGTAPFIARKYTAQAGQLTLSKLKEMLDDCAHADKDIKLSGYDKWIVLETLIVKLSYRENNM